MKRATVVHHLDTRLLINAGMRFPACYAGAPLLDLDKSRLPMDCDHWKVTCKHCQRVTLRAGLPR